MDLLTYLKKISYTQNHHTEITALEVSGIFRDLLLFELIGKVYFVVKNEVFFLSVRVINKHSTNQISITFISKLIKKSM